MLFFICCSNLISKEPIKKSNSSSSGQVSVFSTPDLYNLTGKLADQYNLANPGQSIKVNKLESPEIAALVSAGENFCFVSDEYSFKEKQGDFFQLVVGRDIIVPVISTKNPFLTEINKQGISRESLGKSLGNAGKMQWGTLLNNGQSAGVNYYFINDDLTKATVAKYLKADPSSIASIRSVGKDELVSAIQNDPYAIGFCRITDILQPGTEKFSENIRLMPIDKNNNGRMDYMENIYANYQDFTRGVWIGKYPKALTNNIYCVARSQPVNAAEIAFIQWVLASGQEFMSTYGYSDLVSSERQSQMDKLIRIPVYPEAPKESNTAAKLGLLILALIVIGGFTLDLFIRRYRNKKADLLRILPGQSELFDEKNVIIPGGLFFDKTHTWAFMEKDGTVKIGIDDFLQHVTGPITSIAMKKHGDNIKKGDKLCIIIQKGKHLNIYAPVSGTIKAFNQVLSMNSTLINDSPYADGWVYQIEPSNWLREIAFLTMADKYRSWLCAEFTRLKDFLASSLQENSPRYAQLILQDGGSLRDHVLADLGPEVWEDFQTKFINTSR